MLHNVGGVSQELGLNLTDERTSTAVVQLTSDQPRHRNAWTALKVTSLEDKPMGSWTMIYDEGFEIRLPMPRNPANKLVLTAILDYNPTTEGECRNHRPVIGDSEDEGGHTECYTTNSSRTLLGWYSIRTRGESQLYGCWFGTKRRVPGNETKEEGSWLSILRVPQKPSNGKTSRKRTQFTRILSAGSIEPAPDSSASSLLRFEQKEPIQGNKVIVYDGQYRKPPPIFVPKNPNMKASYYTSAEEQSGYPCKISYPQSFHDLPKNFSSVSNPFADEMNAPPSAIVEEPPVSAQGTCGSCYAMASSYVLGVRASMRSKKFKKNSLSVQNALSCSFLSQGCHGGVPMLYGKWAHTVGVPLEECQLYRESDDEACENSSTGLCERVFASDYGYVGGCYECTSERAMMEEIFYRGPIVSAIDAPTRLFEYTNGVFTRKARESHSQSCDDPNKNLNGWEYTNHAVVIVGWGEDKEKYWIARNSWSTRWGKMGYFKLLRGSNMLGVESLAVYIEPDFQRGLLKHLQ